MQEDSWTRAAFIEELQRHSPGGWPAAWGAAYVYAQACLQAACAELDSRLEIPEMHRTRLGRQMRQVVRLIAEEGPERPARFHECGVVLRPDERCCRGGSADG